MNFSDQNRTCILTSTLNLCFRAEIVGCWYTLEPLHLGSSNEFLQSMFYSRNKKKVTIRRKLSNRNLKKSNLTVKLSDSVLWKYHVRQCWNYKYCSSLRKPLR